MTSMNEGLKNHHHDDDDDYEAKTKHSKPLKTLAHFYQSELACEEECAFSFERPYCASSHDHSLSSRNYPYSVGKDNYTVIDKPCPPQMEYNIRRRIIDHTYRDFSGFRPSEEEIEQYEAVKRSIRNIKHSKRSMEIAKKRRKTNNKFPNVLHYVLSLGERGGEDDDVSDIITWLPHGRSFVVRNKKKFMSNIASSYFKFTIYESYIRQMNGWGFKRITQGPDIDSYYHELFLRGMPHLIKWMKRCSRPCLNRPIRGGRPSSRPWDEPNFYEIGAKYPIPDYYNINGGKPMSEGISRHDHSIGTDSDDVNAMIEKCSKHIADCIGQGTAGVNMPINGLYHRVHERDTIIDHSEKQNVLLKDMNQRHDDKEDSNISMRSFYHRPHMDDYFWSVSRKRAVDQAPSEHDWQSLWDILISDTEEDSKNKQVADHTLKIFILEPMYEGF